MQKLTLSQFGGGLQESTGPRDFAQGEWSRIKGFVFESPTRLETQWPSQTISTTSGFRAVFPIVSTTGTYLVAISQSAVGAIYWCKAPAPDADSTATQAVTWTQLTTTVNRGYDDDYVDAYPSGVTQPAVESLRSFDNYRFVCAVSLPIADYWTAPAAGNDGERRHLDVPQKQGVVPGVLIHSRKQQGGAQQALVCFVNDTDQTVKVVKFPAWRRFPQFDLNRDTVTDADAKWVTPIAKSGDNFWLRVTNRVVSSNVCTLTLKRITSSRNLTINGDFRPAGDPMIEVGDWLMISGVEAGIDGTRRVTAVNSGAKTIQFNVPSDDLTSAASGGLVRMIDRPFQTDASYDIPDAYRMHPYYYINPDGGTEAGSGIIPRANIGVMWKELLLLGDVEWRLSAGKTTYYPSDSTLNFPLTDSNVGPYPNYMYVSAGEVDRFYPYGILEVAPNGSRILGMHIVKDTLVLITTAGGPDDGVIGIRGNLGEVLTSTFNPTQTTFRKELIRGGIGGVDTTADYHRQFSCLWPEAGVAAFVEASGGVWYTNGSSCNRLDMTGPQAPNRAIPADHVAAAGRHLFVWRDGRLLVFSLLTSSGGLSGAWTELVPPCDEIRSMVGTSSELYFIDNNGLVKRFALAGPQAERGIADLYWYDGDYYADVAVPLTLGTPTLDLGDEQTRKNWHRFGISFQTEQSCSVDSIVVRASGVLNYKGSTPSYTVPNMPYFYNSISDELHELVVPAGIGMQNVASAEVTFTGHVVLESVAFWTTGASNKRGDS